MYLTRVEIDVNNRKKQRDLKDLSCYHGWIESAFPHEIEENVRSRKLWRIDKIRGSTYLLILSTSKPDKTVLEKYGVKDTVETKDYDSFLNSLRLGIKARFRIRMNTVKCRVSDEKDKRGRIEPARPEELIPFFLERTEKNGFEVKVEDLDIVEKTRLQFKGQGRKAYSLVSTTYEGNLTITDLDKFKKSLCEGIGKKKAYGFGLLTIIPYD